MVGSELRPRAVLPNQGPLAVIAAGILAANCCVAQVRSFELADSGSALVIHLADGHSFDAPRTSSEQEGFSNAQIAPDGNFIGWTVTFPNCCTSYPLPRSLVIHDGHRIVRIVGIDKLSIFDWRFSSDSQSLIFQRQFPHGNSPHLFRWVRIADGQTLGEFDCYPIDPEHPPKAVDHPPAWTQAQGLACDP